MHGGRTAHVPRDAVGVLGSRGLRSCAGSVRSESGVCAIRSWRGTWTNLPSRWCVNDSMISSGQCRSTLARRRIRLVPTVDGLDLSALFELANLQWAAGAGGGDRSSAAGGLYRDFCVRCHGTSGDGRRSGGTRTQPYPRDYRRGLFKFKRTPLTLPPTDEDLHGVLLRGVPETAMPSFRSLDAEPNAMPWCNTCDT